MKKGSQYYNLKKGKHIKSFLLNKINKKNREKTGWIENQKIRYEKNTK